MEVERIRMCMILRLTDEAGDCVRSHSLLYSFLDSVHVCAVRSRMLTTCRIHVLSCSFSVVPVLHVFDMVSSLYLDPIFKDSLHRHDGVLQLLLL